MAKLKLSVLTI